MFNGTKLAWVSLAPPERGTSASGRRTPHIFPTNEAWLNRRLTAENGGSEWQNGGGSVVESRAASEHAPASARWLTTRYLTDASDVAIPSTKTRAHSTGQRAAHAIINISTLSWCWHNTDATVTYRCSYNLAGTAHVSNSSQWTPD